MMWGEVNLTCAVEFPILRRHRVCAERDDNGVPTECFGSASAIHTRFLQWEKAGFFEALWKAGLAKITSASVFSSISRKDKTKTIPKEINRPNQKSCPPSCRLPAVWIEEADTIGRTAAKVQRRSIFVKHRTAQKEAGAAKKR